MSVGTVISLLSSGCVDEAKLAIGDQTDIQTSMEMLFPVYEGSVVGRPTLHSMKKGSLHYSIVFIPVITAWITHFPSP
jgi:hypothetical protein